MNKSMFLLEVVDYSTKRPFKRRISDSIGNIEDWLEANAQKWSLIPIEIDHDDYGNGIIYIKDDPKCILHTFSTKNIAII